MTEENNIAEIMLIVSKELESIAKREDIKCKFSYLEGLKRGFEIKQEEDNKRKPIEKAIKEIEEVMDEVSKRKKKIVITYNDGSTKNLYNSDPEKTVRELTIHIVDDFNRCSNGFVAYKDVIINPKHVKLIEVFELQEDAN